MFGYGMCWNSFKTDKVRRPTWSLLFRQDRNLGSAQGRENVLTKLKKQTRVNDASATALCFSGPALEECIKFESVELARI